MSLNIELDVSVLAAKGQPNPTRLQSTVLECGKRCGKAVLPQLLPQISIVETPAKTIVLEGGKSVAKVVAKLLCHTPSFALYCQIGLSPAVIIKEVWFLFSTTNSSQGKAFVVC